tara:strand:- start:514 stop:702 length:189 start_codon:yes stop_codon:yes gene_type:complete
MKKLIEELSMEVAELLDNPTNTSVYMVETETINNIQDLVTKLENKIYDLFPILDDEERNKDE